MQIAIITLGSRGDVQPYIALGSGLHDAGHSVRILTHASFANYVHSAGLDFYALDSERVELFQTPTGRALLAEGTNPFAFALRYARSIVPHTYDYMKYCWQGCEGMDVIVSSLLGILYASSIAEKLGITLMAAFLQPTQVPTNAFAEPSTPQVLLPLLSQLPNANYYTHTVTRAFYWRLFSNSIDSARNKVLGLPSYGTHSPLHAIETGEMPLLFGFSPLVQPKPIDWGANVHVTGFWHLDSDDHSWQPPDRLRRFLESGPAPVYVGFGSMSDADSETTTRLVVSALARSQQRGILLTGWQGLVSTRLPETVMALDSVPHDWLFPRVAAAVHHGGAGTTAASLRAGIPTIVVPYISDQPFWGRRIHDLGVGPLPIPRARFSVDRLADALCTATLDQEMRQHAADLGRQLRAEHGVQQAVAAFHSVLTHEKTFN